MNSIWLVALLVFGCVTVSGVLLARSSAGFMERYRENFLSQARLNLADMFLFVDPQMLFVSNLVVLVLVPLVLWAVTGNLLMPLAALVLLAVGPRCGGSSGGALNVPCRPRGQPNATPAPDGCTSW